MKGLLLAEFVQFAEARLGASPPPVAYSPLQTYEYADLVGLVDAAAEHAGMSKREILRSFGVHLFGRFVALYPVFFVEAGSAFDLLGSINTYVHGEVQKLYPDAEFPRFDIERPGPHRLELVYRSKRPLADLAEGLIRGCVAHFGQPILVRREDLDADGCTTRFVLEPASSPPRRRPRP